MLLELLLKVNSDDDAVSQSAKVLQRVVLEMNLDEANLFIDKLKIIEREILAVNKVWWFYIFYLIILYSLGVLLTKKYF